MFQGVCSLFAHTGAAICYPETTAYSDVTSANKVTLLAVLNNLFKVKFCWLAGENLPRGHRFFLLHPLRYYTVRSEVDWREDSCSVNFSSSLVSMLSAMSWYKAPSISSAVPQSGTT